MAEGSEAVAPQLPSGGKPRVLVVDDQRNMRTTTAFVLQQAGYDVAEAESGEAALARLLAEPFEVVLTDLKMAPLDGLAVLRGALEIAPATQVIVMTGFGTVESAVAAMQQGAHDYVSKPFKQEELLVRVQRALEKRRLLVEVGLYTDEFRQRYKLDALVGRSAAMRELLTRVVRVAPTEVTVLITGESGTGKELVARAIHQLSARRDNAFVKLNCAAIPSGLLESELFGHEKGAFTGAISQRIGRFELANRGTVFLDEVGEIPLDLQPKLLRVLQEREFERLGSTRTLRTDARLIAATNRDLAALVGEQKFREDLFYRLNVFPIHVPPLRQRREDIPMLVRHFAQQFATRMKKSIETIPSETMDVLTQYDWPGNIRELQNLIERAVILSAGPTLDVPVTALNGRRTLPAHHDHQMATLEQAERRHIIGALEGTRWVIGGPNGAAARLGMKRSTLQFRMRKLGIFRPVQQH
ncbi:MAG: sigma-54-dependent Fis family transcriptional regulator [Deltaproteobacteria bacterium]|nr:MAG: sigma-54-dependent Fis family transcriptional regulator [Deltaproteobacteria bacterium]